MTFGKTTLIHMVLLVLTAGNGAAATQGFLYLGGFNQSVGAQCYFSLRENSTEGRSVTGSSQFFGQFYRAGVRYAILSPQFLTGHFSTQLNLNQGYATSSRATASSRTSKTGFLYSLDGTFFERESSPVTFFSRAESKQVSRSFAPSYDIFSQSHGIGLTVNNVFLPARLSYQQSSSETSGLGSDHTYDSSNLLVGASHSTRDSASNLQFAYSENVSEDKDSGSQYATASSLIAGRNRVTTYDRKKSLVSSLRYNKLKIEETSDRASFNLAEGFNWKMGKALGLGLNYGWNTSEILNAGSAPLDSTSHTAGVTVTHHLFQSLESRFDLHGRKYNIANGEQTSWSSAAMFDYRKTLTPGSVLDMHYNETFSVTEQNLGTQILQASDEELTVSTSDDNLLANPDVIMTSIIVSDAANPAILYLSDNESLTPDFRVIHVGPFTGLDVNIPGSRLGAGSLVSVTYTYRVDPQSRYTTTQRSLNGSLGFASYYRVFAGISQSEQSYSEGEATIGSGQSLSYNIGGSRTVGDLYASLRYVMIDSPRYTRQYVEGAFRNQYYLLGTAIQVQGTNRYTMYDQSSSSSSGGQRENRFSLSASGSRRLFSNGTVRMSSQYLNVRSNTTSLDGVSIEGNYRWGLGKLSLVTSAKTGYHNIDGDRTEWETKFSMKVVRKF